MHHDDADRKIDAGGQDDQRLRDAEDADDRHLRQDRRQIAAADEMAVVDRHAEQQAQHQNDEGHGRRIDVQEALQALDERKMLFLEGGTAVAAAR